MWIIQTARGGSLCANQMSRYSPVEFHTGGSGSNCSAGIYTGVGAATWITIGIIVYIALVVFGMPDFCHMVNVGDDKKDLEEPLSPKEPQEEAIPRGANH